MELKDYQKLLASFRSETERNAWLDEQSSEKLSPILAAAGLAIRASQNDTAEIMRFDRINQALAKARVRERDSASQAVAAARGSNLDRVHGLLKNLGQTKNAARAAQVTELQELLGPFLK
jgi:hypothetical protein